MGNSSGKHHYYDQYYQEIQKKEGNESEIDLNSLDPYQILNVPKDFTWNQLKNAYRDAALKTHPDKKGGNKLVFDFVTSCFKTLATEFKARESNKSHVNLKTDSSDYFEKIVSNNAPHPSTLVDNNEPFEQRFNKAFDECKYYDEEVEYGYGKMMTNSSKTREDFSIKNVFKSKKVNNNTFNEIFNKNVPVSKEVIKYKEPEALPLAKNLQFTEIGSARPDNYSSGAERTSLQYTDYMIAYNGQRLADPDDIKLRKEFKSVQEFEKYRESKAKKGLTTKEKRYMDKQKVLEEEKEFERQERIKKQNVAIQRAHENANRLLIN
jgi:curved DNA-binding protein CbpA